MADRNMLDGFQPSILDRLTDPESMGTADQRGYSETELLNVVRRDLEELLNTRRPEFEELGIEEYSQVQNSVIGYGLPDFANLGSLSAGDRKDIGRKIGEIVARFEPRLTDIEVIMKDPDKMRDELKENFQKSAIYFHIDAKLRMDPCPPVSFDTILELTQGRHKVDGHIGTSS